MQWRLISPAYRYNVCSGADQRKHQPKLRVTGLCEGNSPVTGEFPSQRASNAENVSIWWRLHGHGAIDQTPCDLVTHLSVSELDGHWLIKKIAKHLSAIWFDTKSFSFQKIYIWKYPMRNVDHDVQACCHYIGALAIVQPKRFHFAVKVGPILFIGRDLTQS